MIIEASGKIRDVSDTVSLEGLECLCWYNLGSCPRGNLLYWREIWLERVGPNDAADVQLPESPSS